MALRLTYVGLWVHDLDDALAFYIDKLGFEIREDVTLEEMGGFILNCDDCQETYEELLARGVEFQQPPTEVPYGIDAALRDPSGNSIRLVQRVAMAV